MATNCAESHEAIQGCMESFRLLFEKIEQMMENSELSDKQENDLLVSLIHSYHDVYWAYSDLKG